MSDQQPAQDKPTVPFLKTMDCTTESEEIRLCKPHNRFCAWKGSDFWHKDLSVQVRLDPDGSVFLSTQEDHVSTLLTATITIEQLYAAVREVVKNEKAPK